MLVQRLSAMINNESMVNKLCFVCDANTEDANLSGRKFYHYLQYAEEIQEQLQLKKVPVLQDPGTTYVCNFHFQPKEEHKLVECFVCGAKKSGYPDRQFFPFAARSKYLKLNGSVVPVDASRTSTYICSVHFKSKEDIDRRRKINFSNCGIDRITKALKDIENRKDRCCVPTCPLVSQPQITDSSFKCYLFPTTKERANAWTRALKIVPFNSRNVVCMRHFDKRHISSDNRLMINAVPTLYLESATEKFGCTAETNESSEISEEAAAQSPDSDVIYLDSDNQSSNEVIEIIDDDEEENEEVVMETDSVEVDEKECGENTNNESVEADEKECVVESTSTNTQCDGKEEPTVDNEVSLNSVEEVLKHLQPLYDLALLSENYKAVGILNTLEEIFKNEIQY